MKRSVWVAGLGSEFDDFLFASIGEEGNGMSLSVISALARLNLDPWQEATKLAELPGETAAKILASLLIEALPDGPSAHLNPRTTAARLTALLPHRVSPDAAPRKTLFGANEGTNLRAGISMYVVFIVFMLAAQLIVEGRQRSTQVGDAPAQISGLVSPLVLPPNSGQ